MTKELGPSVIPKSLQDAYKAEIIFLAVPFSAHKAVAKQFEQWNGKVVVDLTNAFHVAPEELGGLLSSEVVSHAFGGTRLVKAFNHLQVRQDDSANYFPEPSSMNVNTFRVENAVLVYFRNAR